MRSSARHRLLAALPGFLAFVVLGYFFEHDLVAQGWFYVGLGLAISAVFVEPFFSRPQDAIVNSAAGIGAFAALDHRHAVVLWWGYLGVCVVLLLAGMAAAISTPETITKRLAYRGSSRLGRAVVLGSSALILVSLTKAAQGSPRFELLALGTAALTLSISLDWTRVLRLSGTENRVVAIAETAIGPRLLLVSSQTSHLQAGQRLEVSSSAGTTGSIVIARLPGKGGVRYELALEDDWADVAGTFPSEVTLDARDPDESFAGAIAEGSTERSIQFEPARRVEFGDVLSLRNAEASALYQIGALRLVEANRDGSKAVVARASARLIGWPEGRRLRGGTFLPAPHEPVHLAKELSGVLEAGYHEVGKLKGTNLPIGLRVDDQRRGHLAILGMSGMGKTGVAQRVCRAFGVTSPVIALDTTGEYARRLGFTEWVPGDFSTIGAVVYEPAGEPPQRAAELISQCMHAGNAEYKQDMLPTNRVVLLEEAHGFIPEWNFAQRHHQDHVANSSRMIMQARKFGLQFVIVSQRTAVVTKSALSQCENYIVLKTIDGTSLDYLETVIGHEFRGAVAGLERFEALCVGPSFNSDEPVIVSLTPP